MAHLRVPRSLAVSGGFDSDVSSAVFLMAVSHFGCALGRRNRSYAVTGSGLMRAFLAAARPRMSSAKPAR